MARTIHCSVVEVSDMTDIFGSNSDGGFRDLVPWADPYIAGLIEKLRNELDQIHEADDEGLLDELPPRLGDEQADHPKLRPDWSPRNWPRGN